MAGQIYQSVSEGFPVICYYSQGIPYVGPPSVPEGEVPAEGVPAEGVPAEVPTGDTMDAAIGI